MKKIFFLIFLSTNLQLLAQDEELGKRTTIAFVTSEILASDNFENDKLIDWIKAVQQVAGGLMKTEKTNCVVKIISSWTAGSKSSYEISTCPENKVLAEKMQGALNALESPGAKIADFQLLFSFKFGDGCAANQQFSPTILTGPERMYQQISSQTLAESKEIIRKWAMNEVIPVLSYYTIKVDPKFEGVIASGKILEQKTFLNHQTTTVADKNPLYWRGLMEMSKGNLIIPASKIFMHIANYEFDLARRYLNALYRFADKKSLAAHYMRDLNSHLELFYKKHDSLVKAGIKLHDSKKYDQAIQKYNSIIADYPHSAWTLYEIYFSTKTKELGSYKNGDDANALWIKHRDAVYAADPLYSMSGGANNATDGYRMFLRFETQELFKDSKKLKEDMIRYADIALDLEQYSFAAHLFWNLASIFPQDKHKDHTFLVYYLYSLQKLGVREVQSFFKTSYKDEFLIMDKERSDAIKNDPMYKSFKEQ